MDNAIYNDAHVQQKFQDDHTKLLHEFIIGGAKTAMDMSGHKPAKEQERSHAIELLKEFVDKTPTERLLSSDHGESILDYCKKSGMNEVVAYITEKPEREKIAAEAKAAEAAQKLQENSNSSKVKHAVAVAEDKIPNGKTAVPPSDYIGAIPNAIKPQIENGHNLS